MNLPVNPTMGLRQYLLLALLSVLWGGSFLFTALAVRDFEPFTVVFFRAALATAALLAYVRLRGWRMPRTLRPWGALAVMGVLNSLVPHALNAWGQMHIDAGLASILNATTPLFSVVLAHYLTSEEHLTGGRVAGVLLGLAGVAVLIGPEALTGLGIHGWAQIIVLGAALSYACAGIWGRRLREMPAAAAAAGQVACTALMALPLMLIFDTPWAASPGPAAWGAVVGLGLLCTGIAYVIFFHVLATAGATNAMLVTFLIPVSALIFGALILGERPGPASFAGMALIFAGIAAIDGRVFRRTWQKKRV